MGETKLRYAPSGPYVENAEGGGVTPGQGFQLRHVMAIGNALAPIATTNASQVLVSASLADAQTNLRYRAALEIHAQCNTTWTATGTVVWTFEYSADAGSTWTVWTTNSITYGGQAAHDMDSDSAAYFQTVPLLGSGLSGLSDGDTLMVRARAVLSGGVDGGINFNSSDKDAVIQLIEEL